MTTLLCRHRFSIELFSSLPSIYGISISFALIEAKQRTPDSMYMHFNENNNGNDDKRTLMIIIGTHRDWKLHESHRHHHNHRHDHLFLHLSPIDQSIMHILLA